MGLFPIFPTVAPALAAPEQQGFGALVGDLGASSDDETRTGVQDGQDYIHIDPHLSASGESGVSSLSSRSQDF